MLARSRIVYGAALLAAVAPLWMGAHLPMVDLPQHLHLISVLHRLQDPSTLYPQWFALRGELTPYLGYYYVVHLLNWLMPEVWANALFLSAYVAGMALGLAFLLSSLGRPTWPSLLALPFAYGDSFAWGFVNYCAALPLCFLCMGLFVRAISDVPRRKAWAVGLGATLVAVLLFHVQVFAYLGLALPLLLATTSAPEDAAAGRDWKALARPRVYAIAGVAPGVALFLAWVVGRLGAPAEIAPGQPWKAWGPMLSKENLSFKTPAQNWAEFPQVLANMLRDRTDRYALYAVVAVAAAGWALGLATQTRQAPSEGRIERFRLLVLGLLAAGLFLTLPFDIRGYMYYLNTRYAHLAAPLLLAAVPPVQLRVARALTAAAALSALVLALPLARAFRAFDAEATPLDALAAAAGPRPMVMGLIFDTSSQVVNHPVFLHAATVIARERGGASNFSFASTPHSPLKYRASPPATFPSEWHPEQFDYARMGPAYDTFLIRGPAPERVLPELLNASGPTVERVGPWSLVRRR